MAGENTTQQVVPSEPHCVHLLAAKWYLRSTADDDTHRGRLFGDGTVMADCGLVFRPMKALRDRGPALRGYPPDPGQVCPRCKEAGR
ncbi:MAG: hypothetical protein ACRDS1_01185 [Pseudonocardiaceae bacterium]